MPRNPLMVSNLTVSDYICRVMFQKHSKEPAEKLLVKPEHPRDRIPSAAAHWRREQFIPVPKFDLVEALLRDNPPGSAKERLFRQLCQLLEATLHYEFHEQLEELKSLYTLFDPDRDTQTIAGIAREHKDRCPTLIDKFVALLRQANYTQLTREELQQSCNTESDWGVRLNVDFEVFERLEVFGRGDIKGRRVRRRLRNFYRIEEVDVPIYQRLVVLFRLRQHKRLLDQDIGPVFLKAFKNIPKQDIDMLLPGSRVRITLLDQGRIIIPTLAGLGMALFKIIKGAALLIWTGLFGVVAFWVGLVGGTIGYGIKSLLGYFRAKNKLELNLTRNLYYQNLDNNAGVLYRILDEAEEQEFREIVLGYYLLWQGADAEGWTEEQLDRKVETYLLSLLEVDVDFEVSDAMAKLRRLGLVEPGDGPHWRPVAIERVLAYLGQNWSTFFRSAQSWNR